MFDPPIRVGMVQPTLPRYRVPVFEGLGRTPGVDLTVYADLRGLGSLESVTDQSDAFKTRPAPMTNGRLRISQPTLLDAARGDFDALILSWNARLRELPAALNHARKRGVPTILWGHGYSKRENWIRRRLRNRLIKQADAVLLYNHTARNRLIDEGFDGRRIFVALNAIDQTPIESARQHWMQQPAALETFQHEHDIDPNTAAIFISRLEHDKGVDRLLDAWRIVADAVPTARLILVGKGSAEPQIREQIDNAGLTQHVILTGPIYDEETLAPWMLSAAACTYPQAIGLSAMHAFGYGLPIITSDDIASHNPEIESLRSGENAIFYQHGDAEDYARHILATFRDPAQRERLAAAALQTVRGPDGFTLERMVKGFTDALAFVLDR